MQDFSASQPESIYLPQGALKQDDGGVLWRVWAPFAKEVSLVTFACDAEEPNERERREIPMTPEPFGFYSHEISDAKEGLPYYYRLDGTADYPDPASRWQPWGVHRPSAVFFPNAYRWNDAQWRGVAREDLVIYELHVGTFTPEGTFEAIIPRLAELKEFGVTAIEIMPISQFPGSRNWGYDGVHPFAAQNTYGGPKGLQKLVDAAHRSGIGVFLDVVYNHFGPEGCYVGNFGPYFTSRHHTPWGNAINYDGPDSDPVRRFVIDNAVGWVRDFHLDGLRLDAIQTIFDLGPWPIVAEIQAEVQKEAERQNRIVHVIAETNQNDAWQVRPANRGGWGLSAVWSDDFHHSVHALLTGERDGYYRDFGLPEQLVKAFNKVFVYDGCYSEFHRLRRGSGVEGIDRSHFVQAIQNHDQVGNRALGDRFGTILPPEAQRLAAALLLVSPSVPLFFMGEEYGETRPFPFFCSFIDLELVEAVRRGRHREFAELEFKWKVDIPDPQAVATFESAKLAWSWPEGSQAGQFRRMYRDLLAARRKWPGLRDRQNCHARLMEGKSVDENSDGRKPILYLERGPKESRLTAMANLTFHELIPCDFQPECGRIKFSTEDACYGGQSPENRTFDRLYPYELIIFDAARS